MLRQRGSKGQARKAGEPGLAAARNRGLAEAW